MRVQRLMKRSGWWVWWMVAAIVCASVPARALADKIVLKNGRQILAYSVVEEGNKVRYETAAGQLTIPKSIVDHIEKGGLMPGMESPAAAAAKVRIGPTVKEPTAAAEEMDK